MPTTGEYSIAMHWFTFLFITLIPLGWVLVLGGKEFNEYRIVKKLTYSEVFKAIGSKGMILTIGYGFFTNILMLAAIFAVYGIANLIKHGLRTAF